MLLKQLCNWLVGWHTWILRGSQCLFYNGFKVSDDKECEDVGDDQAEEAGSAEGPEQGWG